MEETECYDGKFIKRIMISTHKNGYDADSLTMAIGSSNDDDVYPIFILNKMGSIHGVNIYDLECDLPVYGETIRFSVIENIIPDVISEWIAMPRSIYYTDDKNYHHVAEMCKTSLLQPPPDQISYGVYIFPGKAAISLFIK